MCMQVYICVLVYAYTGVSVRVHVHLIVHVETKNHLWPVSPFTVYLFN